MRYIITIFICLGLALPALAKKDENYHKQKSLPPGLQKKYERTGELPPGWEKKVAKGEVLDDELYRHGTHVERWPGDHGGIPDPATEIIRIQNKIIKITKNTREILDIMGLPN